VAGSVAHVHALIAAGLLSAAEGTRLERGLRRVRRELDDGTFPFEAADEDIHMAIERRLTELVGPVGGKLHTGRSRNDQVAVDLRLWLCATCDRLGGRLRDLERALVEVAERHQDVVLPGYTHLQRAQPVLLAHHLLAYREMLARDRGVSRTAGGAPTSCRWAPAPLRAPASPSTAAPWRASSASPA
jgi:argininosuccinate lyase